jgi:hypothetical protein
MTQDNVQEHMYKETKILQERVTAVEANVDKLHHEQDKMTHNEHVGMDKHGQQMLTLTAEVVHLRETQIIKPRSVL